MAYVNGYVMGYVMILPLINLPPWRYNPAVLPMRRHVDKVKWCTSPGAVSYESQPACGLCHGRNGAQRLLACAALECVMVVVAHRQSWHAQLPVLCCMKPSLHVDCVKIMAVHEDGWHVRIPVLYRSSPACMLEELLSWRRDGWHKHKPVLYRLSPACKLKQNK